MELLDQENVDIPSWICFSSVDGENAPSGESFEECLDLMNKSTRVCAVGINCAPPQFVLSLIQRFKKVNLFIFPIKSSLQGRGVYSCFYLFVYKFCRIETKMLSAVDGQGDCCLSQQW